MITTVHQERYVRHPGLLRPGEQPQKTSASWASLSVKLPQPRSASYPAVAASVATLLIEEDPERWDGLA